MRVIGARRSGATADCLDPLFCLLPGLASRVAVASNNLLGSVDGGRRAGTIRTAGDRRKMRGLIDS